MNYGSGYMPKEQGYRLQVTGCRIADCGYAVHMHRTSRVLLAGFYTLYTDSRFCLTGQVLFITGFSTVITHSSRNFTQSKYDFLYLLKFNLKPLSTAPITNTIS